MQFLTEWISNIILLILLATILELLLPNSSLQRYVKMVVGLLLLVIILTPLLSIFSKDVDSWVSSLGFSNQLEENNVQISLENKKREIQEVTLAYISEQVAVQLKRQVEEGMITKFEKEIVEVDVALEDFLEEDDYLNSITKVSIRLKSIEDEEEIVSDIVPAVALVKIDTTNRVEPTTEQTTNTKEVLQYLAASWLIPVEKIEVLMEGGSLDQ
ncbi:stage III sporulation protein AF [Anaerobacillus sp. CMMVII]|uniref:stage III sporulation protein AF n=1 Tax=Anaerobacillus sp. CMMVII TaxID=2755588 RepID=UPI0021B7D7DC|nr:stage III sporulation protein AF [Anaerobacillus sp. CMMVII]MCT8138695.1 stage III sporulation protein AF [Anaerobacillus sp. CMMVII]